MTIRKKLYLGFSSLSGILLLFGLVSWYYFDLLEGKATENIEREIPAIKLALELHKGAYNATIEQLNYLLYKTPVSQRHTKEILEKMDSDLIKIDQISLQSNDQDLLKQSTKIKQNIIDFNTLYELGLKAIANNKRAIKNINNSGKKLLAEADSFVLKLQFKYSDLLKKGELQADTKIKIQKYTAANQIKSLIYSIIQHEKQERLYKDRAFYKKIQKQIPELLSLLKKLQKISKGRTELKKVKQAQKSTAQYKKALDQWISSETKLQILVTKMNTIATTTRVSTAQAVQNEWIKTDNASKKLTALFSQAHLYLFYALMICFFTGIILAITIPRNIFKSINLLSKFANSISRGDLTTRTQLSSKDEMGVIAKNLDKAADNLQNIIRQIETDTPELIQHSVSLSKVVETNSTDIKTQKQQLEQVATAMSQLAITVEEVVKNATQAASAANTTDTQAIEGYLIISQAVKSINSLANEINQAAFVINQLEDDVRDIDSFIDDFYKQLNLKELNVTNEVTHLHKKEHEFINAANDVSTLAPTTSASTNKMRSKIKKLQFDTKKAVDTIESCHKIIEDSARQTRKSETTLHTITQSVTTINHMNTLLASTAEEQSTVAEEINKSIFTLNNISEKSIKAANETSETSQKLTTIANNLKDSLSSLSV
ncbi:MAG: methyl-accepting chemotaxis protein [Methylococcaceae bacterium]|nr:methyl-accepting chemotaxis protein [Methylococcaceae bacterium]